MRSIYQIIFVLSSLAILAIFATKNQPNVDAANAFPYIASEWQNIYSGSQSFNNANCQLCHQNGGGGNGWNAYGWQVRQGIYNQGLSPTDAAAAAEALDADGNGDTNLAEINANVQPGWRNDGSNIIYFKDGSTLQNQSAPNSIGEPDIGAVATDTPAPTSTFTSTPVPTDAPTATRANTPLPTVVNTSTPEPTASATTAAPTATSTQIPTTVPTATPTPNNNTMQDADADGVPNDIEDTNGNGNYEDDDLDGDSIPNYMDTDDDGDGVETIAEDANQDENPANDDVNNNGIFDYLDSTIKINYAGGTSPSTTIYVPLTYKE